MDWNTVLCSIWLRYHINLHSYNDDMVIAKKYCHPHWVCYNLLRLPVLYRLLWIPNKCKNCLFIRLFLIRSKMIVESFLKQSVQNDLCYKCFILIKIVKQTTQIRSEKKSLKHLISWSQFFFISNVFLFNYFSNCLWLLNSTFCEKYITTNEE